MVPTRLKELWNPTGPLGPSAHLGAILNTMRICFPTEGFFHCRHRRVQTLSTRTVTGHILQGINCRRPWETVADDSWRQLKALMLLFDASDAPNIKKRVGDTTVQQTLFYLVFPQISPNRPPRIMTTGIKPARDLRTPKRFRPCGTQVVGRHDVGFGQTGTSSLPIHNFW